LHNYEKQASEYTRNDAGTQYNSSQETLDFPRYATAEMQCWNQNENTGSMKPEYSSSNI